VAIAGEADRVTRDTEKVPLSRYRKVQLSRSKALLVATGALSVAAAASATAVTWPSGPAAASAQPGSIRASAGGGRQAILSARETSDVLRLTIPVAPRRSAAEAAASRAAEFNSEMAAAQTPAATASPTATAATASLARSATTSPTVTPQPARSATTSPTVTPQPTRSATTSPTATPQPTRSATASPTATPQPTPTATAPAPSGSPRQIAQAMLGSFGWPASQFACLDPLWEHESGWSVTASNASSGAYGIPQAVPGSKMASAGPDWQTNATTQIKWGLRYIKGTYGSPCAAYSHEQSTGWY
jgi:hypothetical protein